MSKCRKFYIDLETSKPLDPFSIKSVDMLNKKCTCEKGVFSSRSVQDWYGTLHCHYCNKITKRYITVSEYREKQINKILYE